MDAGAANQRILTRIVRAFDHANVQLTRHQKAKIEDAVNRKVLGGNLDLRLAPDAYAQSPLIKHIKKSSSLPGIIYVAYVPNNNGKTTACYACMDKPYTRRGIAFSPSTMQLEPYFDFIVRSLGFDSKDPPRGFMMRILDALEEGKPDPELRTNFLILDNFMPHGYIGADCSFLHNLKGKIKNRNVTALILTSNREAACRLIAQNSLGVIVPLASFEQINELRRANRTIDPNEPLDFNWEKEVSMVWEKDELKKALEHSPDFLDLDATKQATIRQRFDNVYNQLFQDKQDAANPDSIAGAFDEMKIKHSTPPKITTPTKASCGWNPFC